MAHYGSRLVALFFILLIHLGVHSQILRLNPRFIFPQWIDVDIALMDDSIYFDFNKHQNVLKDLHLAISQIDSIHDRFGTHFDMYYNGNKTPLRFGTAEESKILEQLTPKLREGKRYKAKNKRKNCGNSEFVFFTVHDLIPFPTAISGSVTIISDTLFEFNPVESMNDFAKKIFFSSHRIKEARLRSFKIITIITENDEKYRLRIKNKMLRYSILQIGERNAL